MTKYTAYLCLGSNLGDRRSNLQHAVDKLQQYVDVSKVSSVFETEPVEMKSETWFYNAGLKIETQLQPIELLNVIKNIERELGRTVDSHFKPREIDIDILLYENISYHDARLDVPHQRLTNRKFALTILNELSDDVQHPEIQKPISELLVNCKDTSKVTRTNVTLNISEQAFG
jgi:2-amino-4-hydroxy-6-hydroxymethyldihydropteridine diphosphokinase